jgi:hypothetical protein
MLLQVIAAFIFVVMVITNISSCSDRVTFDVSAASVESGIIVDALLRSRCPKVEMY